MKSALFLFLFLAACTSSPKSETPPAASQSPADIPLEMFFRNPSVQAFRISPDGSKLAFLKVWKNRMNVFVADTGKIADAKQLTFVEDRDIADLYWKSENSLLFEKDSGGDENFNIFHINLQTGATTNLTPYKGVSVSLVHRLDAISEHDILIQHNQRDRRYFDLYRVNVLTGESKLVGKNKKSITTWLVDHEGNVRGGIANNGLNSFLYLRDKKNQPFKEIFKTGFRNTYSVLDFTADNRQLFVSTNLGADLDRIVVVDPKSPTKFLRTVYSHPTNDISEGKYSNVRKALSSVNVLTDRLNMVFLQAEDQKDWEFLKAKYPQKILTLASHTRDERIWVVRAVSDQTLGSYFIYDRDKAKLTDLGELSPWLPAHLMSEMLPVRYTSRDGLEIQGYLTIPRGMAAKNLPVIINPHGGPWARDEWRFSQTTQFLASRGYAVFQMNFRGSTGYGRKFWEASFKEWGLKMQDDVTDGVKWLVSQGFVDPARVCIFGASYGGYTTLAGITFTPDLYRCAVDYVGVSNLLTFMKTIPPYWQPYRKMMYEMVGDPVKDKKMLEATSPVFHADRIRAPLFIAQGANDPRVNKNESDQMVEALRKRGVVVEYMVKDNEGHGFHNEENRFDFYHAMEKFLAKHLGGRQR